MYEFLYCVEGNAWRRVGQTSASPQGTSADIARVEEDQIVMSVTTTSYVGRDGPSDSSADPARTSGRAIDAQRMRSFERYSHRIDHR